MKKIAFYHLSRERLNPGDRIEAGGLGRRIAAMAAVPPADLNDFDRRLLYTENAYEDLRARFFPQRPSRLKSCFALGDLAELPALLAHCPDLRSAALYRVHPADPQAKIFAADYTQRNNLLAQNRLRPGGRNPLDAATRAYWQKPATRRKEFLIESALVVEECLAAIAADFADLPRAQTFNRRMESRLAKPLQKQDPTMSTNKDQSTTAPAPAHETALPALFADGLTEVTISAGIARITLYRLGRQNQRYNCADLLIPAVHLGSFSSQIASIAEQLLEAQKRAQQSDKI